MTFIHDGRNPSSSCITLLGYHLASVQEMAARIHAVLTTLDNNKFHLIKYVIA